MSVNSDFKRLDDLIAETTEVIGETHAMLLEMRRVLAAVRQSNANFSAELEKARRYSKTAVQSSRRALKQVRPAFPHDTQHPALRTPHSALRTIYFARS